MVLATPGRWLRHKATGTIYGHSDIMAGNSAVEECTEEQAFPERFIPKKQKGRKSGINLGSPIAEGPKKTPNATLGREASRGLKK